MATPTILRPLSYWTLTFRRTWRSEISSTFLTPILYLVSIGIGLGTYVDRGGHLASLGGVSYVEFVAPALLATSVMQAAVTQATYPVLGSYLWSRSYRAMMVTPLEVDDVVAAHLIWMTLRALLGTAIYLVVMACFGVLRSPEAPLDLIVGPMCAMAFAAPIAAYSITSRTEYPFAVIFRLVAVPLALFSGTFFPVTQLPVALRYLTYVLPLWHAVVLSRGFALGSMAPLAAAGHCAYLALFVVVGTLAARRTYARRLIT